MDRAPADGGDRTAGVMAAAGMELDTRPTRILLKATAPVTLCAKIQPSRAANLRPWKKVFSGSFNPKD